MHRLSNLLKQPIFLERPIEKRADASHIFACNGLGRFAFVMELITPIMEIPLGARLACE